MAGSITALLLSIPGSSGGGLLAVTFFMSISMKEL
jgi:hypothetical protein